MSEPDPTMVLMAPAASPAAMIAAEAKELAVITVACICTGARGAVARSRLASATAAGAVIGSDGVRRRARIRHIGGVGTIERHDAVDVGLRQTGKIEIGGRVHHRGIVVEVTQSNRMPDFVGRDEGQLRAAQIVGAIELDVGILKLAP